MAARKWRSSRRKVSLSISLRTACPPLKACRRANSSNELSETPLAAAADGTPVVRSFAHKKTAEKFCQFRQSLLPSIRHGDRRKIAGILFSQCHPPIVICDVFATIAKKRSRFVLHLWQSRRACIE